MIPEPDLYLASQSPRRREYLSQLGVRFQTIPVDIVETLDPSLSMVDSIQVLAKCKAESGLNMVLNGHNHQLPIKPLLAADTLVVLGGDALGKPKSNDDAFRTLSALSGMTHSVITAVAFIVSVESKLKVVAEYAETKVTFGILTERQIRQYIQTEEPMGKAGSYAIQGLGGAFVDRIEGSYSNVVGLPLHLIRKLFDQYQVPYLFSADT